MKYNKLKIRLDMNTLIQKRGFGRLLSVLFLSLTAFLFTACNDDMDVQQAYPFTVETMPVPTRIVKGETVEIRCELKREGRFSDARYTIRYFQPDGKGTLRMDDGMILLPNDRYPLDREVFRLYYTSACEDQQSIDIYFEDNSEPKQLFLLSFDFNNERKEETEEKTEGTVSNPGTSWIRDSLVIVRPPVLKSERIPYANDCSGFMPDSDLRRYGGTTTGRRFFASRRLADSGFTLRKGNRLYQGT